MRVDQQTAKFFELFKSRSYMGLKKLFFQRCLMKQSYTMCALSVVTAGL